MNKDNNIKNRLYWLERAIQQDKLMEKDIKKIEKQLKKNLVEANKEIKKELAYFYAQISEFDKVQLEGTLVAIDRVLNEIFNEEENLLNERFIKTYIDTYEDMAKHLGIKVAFNSINERVVKEIVKTNWSGLTFSERIWENKRKLGLVLKEELNKGIIRGDSLQDISRILSDKLDNSFYNSMRVVRTETAWIQTEATLQSYKDADLKEYEFSAFLDNKTSEACKELDGKIIKLDKAIAGTNLPPLHPHCRSCILPVIK